MFGLLSAAILDEASVLIRRANHAFSEYATCDFEEARAKIREAFGENAGVDDDGCTFLLGDFQFHVAKSEHPAKVSITGKGRYWGFMMQTTDGKQWLGATPDYVAGTSTRDAKNLLKALRKHHGLIDFGAFLRRPL